MEAPELLGEFLRESEELVDVIEQGIVELESAEDSAETIHALFRAAHTLKGNAGMVGLQPYVHFTHVLENLLARVRDGSVGVEREIVDALLSSVDVLRAMRAAVADGEPEGEVEGYAGALQALKDALAQGGDARGPGMLEGVVRDLHVELTLQCDESHRRSEADGLFAELKVIGEVRDVLPDPESGAETYHFVIRTDARCADVEAVALFAEALVKVEDRAPPKPAVKAALKTDDPAVGRGQGPRAKQQAVLRVDAARLDRIVDLMGEMVVAAARAQRLREEGPDAAGRASEASELLETLVQEVQDRVMGLRMAAVRDTFEKFRRPVRDTANELGKEVVFVTEGVETELDRKVLDELADPLKHMVRNAIAHGIESPGARAAAGKPRAGQLRLRARQSEGAAVIEVEDDGAGIDRERVLAKAVERGLVQPGAALTDAQVHGLLFAPGFSTAKEVNEIAGRGVGLDVVKRAVEALHGSIEVVSTMGKGCTWRVRLPLTLAVVDGLYASVGRETVTIPMPSIVELLDPETNAIRTLEGKHEFVDVRGECLPVVRLRRLLDVEDSPGGGGLVVVVQNEKRRFGLVVDRVLGMARAVIKPLESELRLLPPGRAGVRPAPWGERRHRARRRRRRPNPRRARTRSDGLRSVSAMGSSTAELPCHSTLSDADFERLRALVRRELGVQVPPAKRAMIEARLARRLREVGAPSAADYCASLFGEEGQGGELVHFLDAVTTNVTSFFREPQQLTQLGKRLPAIAATARAENREVRVWSAACSRGHEPWTLAMMLSQVSPTPRFAVFGTDVSTRVLEEATTAIYPEADLEAVPAPLRARYFLRSRRGDGRVRVAPELRKDVRFGRVNLMAPSLPMQGAMDVALLRNVLIYFDAATQRAVAAKVLAHLQPDGVLCVGLSESLHGHGLAVVHLGLGIYQRVSSAPGGGGERQR